MRIDPRSEALFVSDVPELSAANSNQFREEICAAMPESLSVLEIDLSETQFIDSCGLGALVSIYRAASRHNGGVTVRLVNPTPPVQQVFELTRMHLIFEISRRREPQFTTCPTNHEIDTAAVHIH